MDLKRLRTFVAVAEQGGVSGAAEALRITQPALSRQVQDLQLESTQSGCRPAPTAPPQPGSTSSNSYPV